MASNEQRASKNINLREALAKVTGTASKPGSRAHSPTRDKEVERLLRRLHDMAIPTVPPVAKKFTQEQLKERLQVLVDKSAIRAIASLPRAKTDYRLVGGKKDIMTRSLTTNNMLFSNFGKDNLVFKVFQEEDPFVLHGGDFSEYVNAVQASLDTIGSSGSMPGVITRLVKGMSSTVSPSESIASMVALAQSVLSYNAPEYVLAGKSAKEAMTELWETGILIINPVPGSGLAYGNRSAIEAFAEASQMMETVFEAIAQGRQKYMTLRDAHRAYWAVALKNKQDYYELKLLHEKTRPYFVYPLHERLMYSCIQTQIKAVRFDEDAGSSSAVGFSWNDGGGDRLYEWLVDVSIGAPGFRSIFYGDDQLWAIKLPENAGTYVFTPDFSHMDLSLKSVYGKVALVLWTRVLAESLDNAWMTVLKLNCERAFHREVVIDSALTYDFMEGLGSGIPGTTKFDEVASAVVNGYVKKVLTPRIDSITTLDALQKVLELLARTVKDKFGLIFKEGSFTPHLFEPAKDEYEFVFLGQRLVKYRGRESNHYIPKPDMVRVVIAATTLKKSFKTALVRQRASMQKLRSLYAGGGFLYPSLAHKLHKAFERYQTMHIRPLTNDEEGDAEDTLVEESEFIRIDWDALGEGFPSREWAVNLFLPVEDKLPLYAGTETVSGLAPPPSESDTAEYKATTFEHDDELNELLDAILKPTQWSQEIQIDRTADVGFEPTEVPPAPSVPVKHMTEKQPLPEEVKREFEKRRAAEREKIRSERSVKLPFKTRGRARRRGGASRGEREMAHHAEMSDDEYASASESFDFDIEEDEPRYTAGGSRSKGKGRSGGRGTGSTKEEYEGLYGEDEDDFIPKY